MVFCFKVAFTTRTAELAELKPSLNFIAIWFSVNFPNLRAFLTSGRPKNIAVTNMAFTSLAVTALEVIVTGFIQTSTPKFPFAKTTLMTSRFSMLGLTDFAFLAPANFLTNFFATTATTMIENSVRNAKTTAPKLGKSLIATASAFTSAKVVSTNITASASIVKNITTEAG